MEAPKVCSGLVATLTCPVCQSKADICSSMATWFGASLKADEQLEALSGSAQAVIEDLLSGKPLRCTICGENSAACVGAGGGADEITIACDECCGHGNEDGWCRPLHNRLVSVQVHQAVLDELRASETRRAAVRTVLAQLVEALDFEASHVSRTEEERYALARAREELEKEP